MRLERKATTSFNIVMLQQEYFNWTQIAQSIAAQKKLEQISNNTVSILVPCFSQDIANVFANMHAGGSETGFMYVLS